MPDDRTRHDHGARRRSEDGRRSTARARSCRGAGRSTPPTDVADGFPVSRDLAWSLARRRRGAPLEDPGIADVFFEHGLLTEGDTLAQPALARTLRHRSRTRDPTPSTPVSSGAGSSKGSAPSAPRSRPRTSSRHAADLLPPLRGRYRDLDVSVTPPGSQGFVLLEALAAVERLGIDPDPTGPDAATLARVLMAASADRDRHLADPESMAIHVSSLLDDGHIAALCDIARGGWRTTRPGPGPATRPGDTIALVAADADGWGVSLIESLFSGFGARGSSSRPPGSSPTIAAPASRSSPDIRTSSRRGSGRRTR